MLKWLSFLLPSAVQVRPGASPTFEFCGFDLSKDEKDRLIARWVREYPELPEGERKEGTLSVRKGASAMRELPERFRRGCSNECIRK